MKMINLLGIICGIVTAGALSAGAEPGLPAPAASSLLAPPPVAPPSPAAPAAAPATNAGGGKIVFQMPNYDFGKCKAGDPVKYTFVFTNVGTDMLEVKNVRPGCGCTTAGEWTKRVAPGATGSIPIQVNIAASYPNGPVGKYVDVDSSDASSPTTRLNLHGVIWKPIEVNPQVAMLNNVPVEAPETRKSIVTITNNTDENFTITDLESANKSFTATIKTNVPGKSYEVTVQAVAPVTAGPIQGQITMKTTSTNAPTVSFTVYATIVAAVAVMPPQVTLPFAPIATKLTPQVTIQNNGTNNLVLSDAAVNVKDISVQVNEINPGRTFNAVLTVPEGFEIAQGQKVELTFKSNNPQFPLVKVPITQMQRPKPPPIAPNSGVQIKAAVPNTQVLPPIPARAVNQ